MSWTRSSVSGKVAPARCAHSSAYCSKTNSVYIFGGWDGKNVQGDLSQFHVETSSWLFPLTHGKKPTSRAGHSGVALNSHTILVFGGIEGEFYTSDVYLLDVDTMEWKEMKTSGNVPMPRSRHSATVVGSNVYIYGGSDNHMTFNSLYCLDTLTMKWSIPNCTGSPPASWGHGAIYYAAGNSIYFYGGNSASPLNSGDPTYNGLSILDLTTLTWRLNVESPEEEDKKLPSRAGHTFTPFNNKFVVFGGVGDGGKILNDTFVLDPVTLVWRQFTADNTPTFRCSHTAEIVSHQIFMFGGSDGHRYFKDIAILDAEKVMTKIDQAPKKKRIRLRPFKNVPTTDQVNTENGNEPIISSSQPKQQQQQQTLDGADKPKPVVVVPVSQPKQQQPQQKEVETMVKPPPPIPPNPPKPAATSKSNEVQHQQIKSQLQQQQPKQLLPQPKQSTTATIPNPIIPTISFSQQQQSFTSASSQLPPIPPLPMMNGSISIKQDLTINLNNRSGAATPATTAANIKFKGIIEWLSKLNLSKYEDNFIRNEITVDILDYVTEQHLIEDLEIPTLGARLKILNAIQLEKDAKNEIQNKNKRTEKSEKELLKEAIEQLRTTSDSILSVIQSIPQPNNNNNNNNNNGNNHHNGNHNNNNHHHNHHHGNSYKSPGALKGLSK
ncbi:hypothetical protein DFA_07481 [Cavenderia fasciculata]|uniref:SAM domain-containing protein n=1 Tax=Cavenderia fasciculata TaxID=261658 RepID=F4PWJ3_CACFS|nr:uncharacterized protein DFA_07481 [Cavenderia fasciculata]EGG20357.1 hypothetical protein DFA_07481 [Cavenderia fasciculata]|eukprot:XP_004367340.1 hypothetical protein DFA_07481 [Cavenderia fasciculata]